MKKYLLFAAALLGLVACTRNNADEPNAPKKQIVLTATVNNNGSANGPHRVAPEDPTAATVKFTWEAGDKVIISNATGSEVFTIDATSISPDGKSANFEGTALADMTNYTVHYGYNPADEVHNVAYIENSFKPFIKGNGNNDGFTLDYFYPVLKFDVSADYFWGAGEEDFNLLYINYSLDKSFYSPNRKAKVVLTDVNKLMKFTTPVTIYLPVLETSAEGFCLEFIVQKDGAERYDVPNPCPVLFNDSFNGNYGLITNLNLTLKNGKIINLSPLTLTTYVDHGGAPARK